MDKYRNLDLTDEQSYSILLQGVAELQSLAADVGIEREKLSSISEEEYNKSTHVSNAEETLQVIKQTTDIARFAMILLVRGVAELQSLAADVGIEREKLSSISEEEYNKSTHVSNAEETLQVIKQTTDIARFAMILLVRGAQIGALNVSHKSKIYNSFSSAISYLREEYRSHQPPKHLLVEWEGNATLIDLFTKNEGLYCNRHIAQDMFDICLDTFDWLRSFADNHQ
ncbi:unnamed protein product [Rotaria socialis]